MVDITQEGLSGVLDLRIKLHAIVVEREPVNFDEQQEVLKNFGLSPCYDSFSRSLETAKKITNEPPKNLNSHMATYFARESLTLEGYSLQSEFQEWGQIVVRLPDRGECFKV